MGGGYKYAALKSYWPGQVKPCMSIDTPAGTVMGCGGCMRLYPMDAAGDLSTNRDISHTLFGIHHTQWINRRDWIHNIPLTLWLNRLFE